MTVSAAGAGVDRIFPAMVKRRPANIEIHPWRRRIHARGAVAGCDAGSSATGALPCRVLLVLAGLVPSFHAAAGTWSGAIALSSQLDDRGVAVTAPTPSMQGMLNWTPAPGWSLGLSGGAELRSPGRLVQSIAEASHYWAVSTDWQMQANLLYYHHSKGEDAWYPSRLEAAVGWTYRDVLTFNLSTFRPTSGRSRRWRGAADLDLRWPLMNHLAFSAGIGIAQPPATFYGHYYSRYDYGRTNHYSYGQAGLIWNRGPWNIEIDRIVTSAGAPRPRGSFGVSPWVATLSFAF